MQQNRLPSVPPSLPLSPRQFAERRVRAPSTFLASPTIATFMFLTVLPWAVPESARAAPSALATPSTETSSSRPDDSSRRTDTVTIILAGGDAGTRATLTAAFRDSLNRAGIDLQISNVATMSPAEVSEPSSAWAGRVILWLDLTVPKAATVYLTDGKNVFTRRMTLARDFDPVALDLLDVVVTSTIQAVLAGKQMGVPREEFKRSFEHAKGTAADQQSNAKDSSLPPPVRSVDLVSPVTQSVPAGGNDGVAREHRQVWSVAGAYGGALVAGAQGVHGPSLLVDVERGSWRLGSELSWRFPYESSGTGATVRLTAGAARLSIAHLLFFGRSLVGIAAVGIGADLTRVQTVSTQAGVMPATSFWALDPAVRPVVGVEARPGRLRIGIVAGVDVDLIAPNYVVGAAPAGAAPAPVLSSRSVWSPWRWRPFAALLVGFFL